MMSLTSSFLLVLPRLQLGMAGKQASCMMPHGQSPRLIAPDIFPLARRKSVCVHAGLTNGEIDARSK
jgi:hypothetical protein